MGARGLLSPAGRSLPPRRFSSEEVCTCPQASVPQQFASVPWNSFSSHVLAALYGFAPISMHCNKSSAVRFQACPRPQGGGLQGHGWSPSATPLLPPARRRRASARAKGMNPNAAKQHSARGSQMGPLSEGADINAAGGAGHGGRPSWGRHSMVNLIRDRRWGVSRALAASLRV